MAKCQIYSWLLPRGVFSEGWELALFAWKTHIQRGDIQKWGAQDCVEAYFGANRPCSEGLSHYRYCVYETESLCASWMPLG